MGGLRARDLANWTQSKAILKANELMKQIKAESAPLDQETAQDDFLTSEMKLNKLAKELQDEEKKMSQFRLYIRDVAKSSHFQRFIMFVILVNTAAVTMETEGVTLFTSNDYSYLDSVFLAIYTVEFMIKIYADPRQYWNSGYDKFDFVMIVLSYLQYTLQSVTFANSPNFSFLRVARALRALRALRSISFIRSLQVLVNAFLTTLKTSVIDLLILLILLLFLFGVMGFYFFGDSDPQDWGSLGTAIFSLFDIVTADGWTSVPLNGADLGIQGIQIFCICFMLMGHFLFTNLFVGTVIQNVQNATEEDRKIARQKKEAAINIKKALFLQKQQADIDNLMEHRRNRRWQNMQDMLHELAGTLRNDDVVSMNHLSCNLQWIETYMASLHHQENTVYRCQQLHFELANTLAEMYHRRLSERKDLH